METFIYAVAILAVSVVCYGVCRLFGCSPKFKTVSYVIANIIFFVPLVAVGLLLFAGLTAVAIAVIAFLLRTTGTLAVVTGWRFWKLLPDWAWFIAAVLVAYLTFMLYGWRGEIARWRARRKSKASQ
ncbi:hypothetical protein GALL_81470 [mine drainage metagenome]|uniref:Uncharacterized protein n=1 Tax=mine drainage metagenome TaxID=410659 RepID=A0A1J5TCA2_9ZZZZ